MGALFSPAHRRRWLGSGSPAIPSPQEAAAKEWESSYLQPIRAAATFTRLRRSRLRATRRLPTFFYYFMQNQSQCLSRPQPHSCLFLPPFLFSFFHPSPSPPVHPSRHLSFVFRCHPFSFSYQLPFISIVFFSSFRPTLPLSLSPPSVLHSPSFISAPSVRHLLFFLFPPVHYHSSLSPPPSTLYYLYLSPDSVFYYLSYPSIHSLLLLSPPSVSHSPLLSSPPLPFLITHTPTHDKATINFLRRKGRWRVGAREMGPTGVG